MPSGRWNAAALRRLEGDLVGWKDSEALEWARRTVGDALIALDTARLLRSRRNLDSGLLRRALVALRVSGPRLPPIPPCRTEVEAVEAVAFDYPASEDDCRNEMLRFILLVLGPEAGQADEAYKGDDEERQFRSWADPLSIGPVQINEAREFARNRQPNQHLSLVVSLHTSIAGSWPESLEAWLLIDGKLHMHDSFWFATVDREGAERALKAALAWAHEGARGLGHRLRRVDVAAPAELLLGWRPEEAVVGGASLGVHHEVVAHWSQRLSPLGEDWWILEEALERLATIDACRSGAPVDWLAEEQAGEAGLRARLQKGHFKRAIALGHHAVPEVMKLLFAYFPIVLWPAAESGFPEAQRSCLDRLWQYLPERLMDAYRQQWQEEAETDNLEWTDEKEAENLSALRAVWDNRDWLEFCGKVTGQSVREPGSKS